jgi:hypothetical protein
MKKTIVLILLLIPMICFAGALQEKHRSVIAKKNAVAPAACEVISGAPSQTEVEDYLQVNIANWSGITYTPGSNVTVCQLDFSIHTYESTTGCTASIFTKSGDNLSTPAICSSNSVSAANGWVEFPLTADCNLTASTAYALVYNCTGGGTYWTPDIHVNNGNGTMAYWGADGAFGALSPNYMSAIKVYSK